MEDRICKVLKGVNILCVSEYYRTALVEKDVEGNKFYIIIRMVHPIKSDLNIDGTPLTPKQIKGFVPIVVKALDDWEYMQALYDKLVSVPFDYDD